MIDEDELDIPNTVIDRAHQIGPEYSNYKTKKKSKSIILRFTTSQNIGVTGNNVKIRLDLTKERHVLPLEANNKAK